MERVYGGVYGRGQGSKLIVCRLMENCNNFLSPFSKLEYNARKNAELYIFSGKTLRRFVGIKAKVKGLV